MTTNEIAKTICKFFFPFSYTKKHFQTLCVTLEDNGFKFKTLDANSSTSYAEELDQFFYPFIQEKIFYKKPSIKHINRFLKEGKVNGKAVIEGVEIPFTLNELNIFLCPFNTGIASVTVTLPSTSFNDSINFMDFFRQLKMKSGQKKKRFVQLTNEQYETSQGLLFNECFPFLENVIDQYKEQGYVGGLPYFEDERMYCLCYLAVNDNFEITNRQLYRLLQLDGTDEFGHEKISSVNERFIDNYIESHSYNRWMPRLYLLTTLQVQTMVTDYSLEEQETPLRHFHSTLFYNFILHYFYKIVLLKLTYEHSEIKWNSDKVIAESLIEKITSFSSTYYFQHVAVRSSGRDIASLIREQLRVDALFKDVKHSVNDLYRVLEDEHNDRYNQLLFILTVFTVISGVYGMNLVIESWDKDLKWSSLKGMTFFEIVAFFTGILGIWLSIFLTIGAIARMIIHFVRKRKHQS